VTSRHKLRVLGAPTGIAVVVVSLVITWGMRKRTEYAQQFQGKLTYIGLDLIDGHSFLGRRYIAIEVPNSEEKTWLRVDYSGPGYNHFVAYFDNGSLQCEGECLVDFPVPNWDLVRWCKCYNTEGELISEVVHGEGTQTWLWESGSKDVNLFVAGDNVHRSAWYDNGQLHSTCPAVHASYHGHYQRFHYNGVLAAEGDYIHGRQVGQWKWYDDAGRLEREENFDDPKWHARDVEH
jgi:hypothetical protein